MPTNVHGVIQGLIGATKPDQAGKKGQDRRPVITLSRNLGSGGDDIARALSERLGLKCYDKTVLNKIAEHAQVDGSLMTTLHEQVSRSSDAWLYSLVFGKNVTRDDYTRFLVTTVRGLYWAGGIVLGRGGHVILAGRDVLRVRIIGSLEACAKRIAHQDNIDLAEAKKKVRDSNRRRGEFIWEVFHSRLNEPINFDLVVNTDHFADYGHVVDLIMGALHSMGLDKPQTGTTNK